MNTVTIPKSLAKKGDLVVITRAEYDTLRDISRVSGLSKTKLDRGLEKAIKEYRAGKAIGPFKSAGALMRSLRSGKWKLFIHPTSKKD